MLRHVETQYIEKDSKNVRFPDVPMFQKIGHVLKLGPLKASSAFRGGGREGDKGLFISGDLERYESYV